MLGLIRIMMFMSILVALTFVSHHALQLSPTERYMKNLSINYFERNGTNYTAPNRSPFRILSSRRSLTSHEITYLYDYSHLETIERKLNGVDRLQVLRALFHKVTAHASTDHDRHIALLRFLHKAGHHNLIQPMYRDGQAVYDPLVLLELGEMRCGQVNRVAVDLFRAAGYRARIVQAAFHQLAEVYYDGSWHYFDADIFGNGDTVIMPDGTIPSMVELSRQPEKLDALAAYWEPDHANALPTDIRSKYPSWFYFSRLAYEESGVSPAYVEKTASETQESRSQWYGWNFFEHIPDPDRCLYSWPKPFYSPAAPLITQVKTTPTSEGNREVTLEWECTTPDVRYRVFLGSSSRGWNYNGVSVAPDLMRYKSSQREWIPEMYEARYRLPPSDLGCLSTSENQITVEVPLSQSVYITVMPVDAHGEAVGRRVFAMSGEIYLDADED